MLWWVWMCTAPTRLMDWCTSFPLFSGELVLQYSWQHSTPSSFTAQQGMCAAPCLRYTHAPSTFALQDLRCFFNLFLSEKPELGREFSTCSLLMAGFKNHFNFSCLSCSSSGQPFPVNAFLPHFYMRSYGPSFISGLHYLLCGPWHSFHLTASQNSNREPSASCFVQLLCPLSQLKASRLQAFTSTPIHTRGVKSPCSFTCCCSKWSPAGLG